MFGQTTLESIIQEGISLTLSERLGIVIDVCNSLADAHGRGLIYRDIKPASIFVRHEGERGFKATIRDLGMARVGGEECLCSADQIVGTLPYMSPEQLRGKEIDKRADIYATGVVLFQLLTGVLPFDSPDIGSTLLRIVNEPPPRLSNYIENYPPKLDEIVSGALAKKREERYASAKELGVDLAQVQNGLK